MEIIQNLLMNAIVFSKLFLLFLSITVIWRTIYRLAKSIITKQDFVNEKKQLTYLALSISYVLTIIFF